MNLSTLELFHAPIKNNILSNSIAYVVLNTVLDDARVLKTAYFGRKFGARAVVYGITASPDADRVEINGVEVSRVANPRYSLSAEAWPRDIEERDMHRFCHIAAQRIGAQILEQRPMLLHTHDMYGIYVGAYCQNLLASEGIFIPWVHDVHEYSDGLTMLPKSFQALAVEYERDFIRQPDHLLTVSPPIARILTEKFALGASPTVIFNCPSKVRSGTADLRTALGLGDDRQIVVYSGGLTRERGTHTLVEALKFLPPSVVVAFVAADRGGMIAELTALAESFGVADRIYFRPYVANAEVTSFLRTADVGCHPMIHFPNGEVALPNKIFEYLHAGLPLVVSDVAQMKEFVETTETGAVFAAEDAADLARAVADTLRDRAVIRERVSPAFLDRYCWESEETKLDRIYRDLLQPRPSGSERRAAARRALASRAGDTPAASGGVAALRGLRILHGPGQGAGQPLAIANAQRKLGLAANHVLINPPESGISYPAHRTLIANRLFDHPHWRLAARILHDYDILHLYSRPLIRISPEHRFPSGSDLMVARALGIPVIMDFLGSEIRLDDEFRRKNRFHWLDEDDGGRTALEAGKRRFISLCRGVANRMVALDAEVQSYVPDAVIIERAVDLDEWRYVGPSRTERPLVVHAPSNRLFKGTEFVLRAVEELKNEGEEFDFQLIEDVPNATAREMLASADIVIDQLRIGWYGVLACEAMALGKPVVVYIRPDLLDYFATHGCPFILADPTSVKEQLQALIRDPQARQSAGAAGRSFVTRVHDARVIAGRFAAMYSEVLQEEEEIADIGALVEWYRAYEGEFIRVQAEANETRSTLEALASTQQDLEQLKVDMQRVSTNARRAVAARDESARELKEAKTALADALKRANEAEVLRARAEAAAAEVAAETARLRARIAMPDKPAPQAAAASGAGEAAPSGAARSRRLPWANRLKGDLANGEATANGEAKPPASAKSVKAIKAVKAMSFGIGPEPLMASLQGRRGDLLSPLLVSLGLDRHAAICVAGPNVQQQEAFSFLVDTFPNIDVLVKSGDKARPAPELPRTVRAVSEISEGAYDLIVLLPSLVTIGQWMKEELPGWVNRGLKPDGIAVTYFVRLHALDAIKDKVPAPLLEFVQTEFATPSDMPSGDLPSFLASQYRFIANVDRRIGTTAYLSWLALQKVAMA